MKGKFQVVGYQRPKSFTKGTDVITFSKLSIRDTDGKVMEIGANPEFDFGGAVDKEVTLVFSIRNGGKVRAESVL